MEREKVFLKIFGRNLISFKKLQTGEIIGTGILNPILDKFSFFSMIIVQINFYRGNANLGKWHGKKVANTFAPPVGGGPMLHLIKTSIIGRIFRNPRPIAMTFAITYNCQCNCFHCSAGKHLKKNVKELTTLEAKKLIDDSQNLGVSIIAFTGGEPLLREDLFELIAHVDPKKAVPLLFTNGQFLTDENVEKLEKAGLYSAFVSIDSPYPEDHDRLRGKQGLFNDAMKGIDKLMNKGILVGISSYATRSATEKGMYKKIYDLARKKGLKNVMLFDGVPTGNILKDTSEILTSDQRNEIREFSSKLFKNSIVPPLSSQAWQNSIEGYFGGIGCLAGNIQYYVSAYGDVTPCDFTPLSFGNIRKEKLKTIWTRIINHPAYNHRSTFCRMQNPSFRQFYIDPIPDNITLPYEIEKLDAIDYRNPPKI